MKQKFVIIGGEKYDAKSGLRIIEKKVVDKEIGDNTSKKEVVKKSVKTIRFRDNSSRIMHAGLQKSRTLNRRILKNRPQIASKKPMENHTSIAKKPNFRNNIKTADIISKFAKQKKILNANQQPVDHSVKVKIMSKKMVDGFSKKAAQEEKIVPAKPHVLQKKANAVLANKHLMASKKPIIKPSKIIKEEAIAKALKKSKTPTKSKNKMSLTSKIWSLAGSVVALVLLGGYLAYINMPNISTRVAAMQSGINATFPEYQPSGYSLNGPVAFNDDKVAINFKSNSSQAKFVVNQTKSAWDSSALLDNFVKEKSGNNYIVHTDSGLTIYTFKSNAAWVSGGILYTISGDAPLSSDQILKIATSM